MLWFRYRWVLTFSRGLCVKIIRGGEAIKRLSSDIGRLFNGPMNAVVFRALLKRIALMIGVLDDIIFSAGALLYREEKSLIDFGKVVERAAEKMIKRLRAERGRYWKDAQRLENKLRKLKDKKKGLPKKAPDGLQRKVENESARVAEDEAKKNEYVQMLHEVTGFIEELDRGLHNLHLEAKAQKRRTLNIYSIKEKVIIRSNFRLGELTGRRGGVEVGSLLKMIRKNLHNLGSIVNSKKRLNVNQIKRLLKYCRIEAKNLEQVFMFAVQLSERIKEWMDRLKGAMTDDAKIRSIRSLSEEYLDVSGRLKALRRDIQTQYNRLDNEFKQGGFAPGADVQRELKAA